MKAAFVALALVMLAGCDDGLDQQSRLDTLAPADDAAWPAQGAAIEPPAHTVSQGKLENETARLNPPHVDMELLRHGEERYNIFCAPCHGPTGSGNGIVVARGFPRPPSFYADTIRQASADELMETISNGIGQMYGFADRLAPRDRWAVIAYLRALQLADAKRAPP